MTLPPLSTFPDGLLFFDGVCNLCNAAVDFILRTESAPRLRFCALQSDFGQTFLRAHCPQALSQDAIVFYHEGRCYMGDEALWEIAAFLRRPYRWLRIGRWLPASLRKWFYRQVADHRYRWFGRRAACRLPTADERARFLA